MEFQTDIRENILYVDISGDLLGINREQELLNFVQEQIQEDVKHCAVDISQVGYMNSTGLSFLIRLLTRFRNQGGDLVLVNPSEQARKLLVITKLNNIFSVCDSNSEAIKALKSV
ncbi:MAG: STAS domain-containing protein [Bernardetiaceae bacterium]|nr:STAS domain-containing protein [Bernardetiaceae bacterium]